MNDRFVSMLCLCRKAGRLAMGFDVMKEAVEKQKACLVVLTADASPKTVKETAYLCSRGNVPTVTAAATMEELWYLLGKRCAVLAVTDRGFAEKLLGIAGIESRQTKEEHAL